MGSHDEVAKRGGFNAGEPFIALDLQLVGLATLRFHKVYIIQQEAHFSRT